MTAPSDNPPHESVDASSVAAHQVASHQVELPEYRSISTLAVVALLLGLASVTAFAAPLLLAIPAAAIVAALAAMASIARSDDRLIGRRLAQIAIALALVCATAAVVRGPVRNALLDRQAVAAVRAWFEMLAAGQLEASLERLSPRGERKLQPSTDPGETPPPLAEIHAHMLDQLAADPVATRLANFEHGFRVVKVDRISPPIRQSNRITLQNVYRVEPAASGSSAEAFDVTVQLTRSSNFEDSGMPLRIDDWALKQATSP